MHRAFTGHVGDPSDPLHREPGLGPPARRDRIEAGLSDRVAVVAWLVLHQEPSGLELDVLAVGVGEQVLPDAARPRERPQPHLLPGHVLVAGPVAPAVVVVVVVAAEEVVQLADDVVGLVAVERVVAIERQEAAHFVDRPGALPARVLQVGPAGHEDLQVVLRKGRRRHPVVVRLLQRGGVVPERVGLEVGLVGRQPDLDAPVRARRQVHGADEGAHAAVVVLAHRVVDRGCGRRGVADDAEVELDAARGPRSAQRDVAEFHDLVAVNELVPRLLHHRAPHLPAHFGKDEYLDEVVLHLYNLPLPRFRGRGIPFEGVVGIQPAVGGEDRDRVGVRKRVGVEDAGLLGDAGGVSSGRGTAYKRDGKQSRGEHE